MMETTRPPLATPAPSSEGSIEGGVQTVEVITSAPLTKELYEADSSQIRTPEYTSSIEFLNALKEDPFRFDNWVRRNAQPGIVVYAEKSISGRCNSAYQLEMRSCVECCPECPGDEAEFRLDLNGPSYVGTLVQEKGRWNFRDGAYSAQTSVCSENVNFSSLDQMNLEVLTAVSGVSETFDNWINAGKRANRKSGAGPIVAVTPGFDKCDRRTWTLETVSCEKKIKECGCQKEISQICEPWEFLKIVELRGGECPAYYGYRGKPGEKNDCND